MLILFLGNKYLKSIVWGEEKEGERGGKRTSVKCVRLVNLRRMFVFSLVTIL